MQAILADMTRYDWLALLSALIFALAFGMRDIRLLRWLTILACGIDVAVYYFIRPGQPLWVQFGESLLFIFINLYHLALLWYEKRIKLFHGREGLLFEQNFSLFSPGEFKRLLKLGTWEDVPPNTTLITKSEPVPDILFFVEGTAAVRLDDTLHVGHIYPGQIAGEVSYFTDGLATAHVVSQTPCTLFKLSHKTVRQLDETHQELYIKLSYVLGRHVASKLSDANPRHFSNSQITEASTA